MPGSLRLGAFLILLLPACGLLSREELLRRDLRPDTPNETLTTYRGIEPMSVNLWMYSAFKAGEDTAEEALAIVDRGLQFHPSDPNLLRARVDLEGEVNGPRAKVDAARDVLGAGRPAALQAELHMLALDGNLRLDDPDAASEEALRLGAVSRVDPKLVSVSWARIALTYEFLGRADEADEALDLSLEMGPTGVGDLLLATRQAPERIAAARSLAERAAERHPRDPDVALYLCVDLMLQGDVAAAEEALDALPGPLPWRLQSSSNALRARMRLQQDRVDEALALLGDWLDRYPRDTVAVGALLEVWMRLGRPDDATMIDRLESARSRLHPPAMSVQIEQVLKQLQARSGGEAADAAEG